MPDPGKTETFLKISMLKIKNVAVIGEGKMGSSIFFFLNGFDFHLNWLCSSEDEKDRAQSVFSAKTKRLWKSGAISEDEYLLKSEKIKITAAPADLKNCDLIIEAITEDREAKKRIFELLDAIVHPACIFTTNSSSIVPSLVFPSESRKPKVAGLHFFYPVAMRNTVELIASPITSPEIIGSLIIFLREINKIPFLQVESNAFVLNRLFLDFQADAFHLLQEDAWSCSEIDEIVKTCFFPIGIFEFFDHVGIDIMHASIGAYIQNADNREFYAPMMNELWAMVKENQLGIKTGRGFYDYSGKTGTPRNDRPVTGKKNASRQEVRDRLWGYYMRSVASVIDSRLCSREELAGYLKDYLGTDNDPFRRIGD
jgi:3-hydroxybutyryl-CoA dehydrogenase